MKKIILTIAVFMVLNVFCFSVSAETISSSSSSESSTTSDVSGDESSSNNVENDSSDPFKGYILIGQITEKENSISGTLSNLGMICIGAGIFGIVSVILWSIFSAMAYKKKQKELEKAKRRRKKTGKKRRKPADGQVRRRRPIEEIQSESNDSTIVVPTEEIEEQMPVQKDIDKYDTQEILRDFLNS